MKYLTPFIVTMVLLVVLIGWLALRKDLSAYRDLKRAKRENEIMKATLINIADGTVDTIAPYRAMGSFEMKAEARRALQKEKMQ
jgi:hypothetical protein